MKIEQREWTHGEGWVPDGPSPLKESAQLVLVFGATPLLKDDGCLYRIRKAYPRADFIGCSTAGEICGPRVFDDSLVTTAVHFESTTVNVVSMEIMDREESFEVGKKLAQSVGHEGLVHLFVVSDGLNVNGSALVQGLSACLPEGVTISGGLAGDGERFAETLVVGNGPPARNTVAVAAFYGEGLRVCCCSFGGWDPFGPERLVTRSRGNVLYELDGRSALEIYKQYLGTYARGLPATALLFPLSIRFAEDQKGVVRCILGIDEDEKSMTFAGDIPKGAYARFMKANADRLVDGAVKTARSCIQGCRDYDQEPDLAVLISCVGRKMVLKQRVEEEIEGVQEVLGSRTAFAGFYSYGEIAPSLPGGKSELHNQTMTVTTFLEK
ncbi:MAG TPA: FIST N-terminal domain-containing protein [Syntrophales bacterium]|nr:FIST N-terminal domain-containing protein [Syntrophales bacterium]HRT70664.1 FIST N-terminal domain-containing protein [Syntrophales bacterium]